MARKKKFNEVGAGWIVLGALTAGLGSLYKIVVGDTRGLGEYILNGGTWFPLLGLTIVAAILTTFKKTSLLWYGVFETAFGVYLNYRTLRGIDFAATTPEQRLMLLIAGVYITKRGLDVVADAVEKMRPAAKAPG